MMARTAFALLACLAACKEDGHDDSSSSSPTGAPTGSTDPDFTDCQDCPIGGDECPAGQICVSRIPGSGGIYVLACEQDNPEPCT